MTTGEPREVRVQRLGAEARFTQVVLFALAAGAAIIVLGILALISLDPDTDVVGDAYQLPWMEIIVGLAFLAAFLSAYRLLGLVRDGIPEDLFRDADLPSTVERRRGSPRFFKDIVTTIRSLIMMLVKTPYFLLPSAAHASLADDEYNKILRTQLESAIERIKQLATVDDGTAFGVAKGLTSQQIHAINNNWIEQINWTNSRANRERDANELMRWWQIVLGVLVPVLANLIRNPEHANMAVTVIGIALAAITGLYQFRRPEDRWRHYRGLHERYVNELWSFVTLSGDYLEYGNDYQQAYREFNTRMYNIRREELGQFFSIFTQKERKKEDRVPPKLEDEEEA